MQTAYQDDDYGLQATSVGLLNAWPDLRQRLITIYSDNVSALPFVPSDWLQAATTHLTAADGAVWVPQPHPTNPPEWLQSADAQAAWKQIFDRIESAVSLYAQGKAQEGAAELASLNLSAEFWNTLYTVASVAAAAPGAIISGAGRVGDSIVGAFWSSGLGKTVILGGIALAVVAVVVLFPTAKKVAIGKVKALA